MYKAFIFDSRVADDAFMIRAQFFGVKVCSVCDTTVMESLTDVYRRAAYDLGVSAQEGIVVTSDPEVLKAARRAEMTCFALRGQYQDLDLIMAGADVVYDDINQFPFFNNVDDFDLFADREIRRFYDQSIIGKLIGDAMDVMKRSYSPYSHFPVGASIYTETGNVYKGCNVENASFGGAICAERGAAMSCIAAEGAVRYKMIAVTSEAEDPAPPCAICRQFLSEFTSPDAQVYLYSVKSKVLRHYSFGVLMPYTFTEF